MFTVKCTTRYVLSVLRETCGTRSGAEMLAGFWGGDLEKENYWKPSR